MNLLGIIADDTADAWAKWQTYMRSERRYATLTCQHRTDEVGGFLTFLQSHLGQPVTLRHLAELTITDFRSWLAALAARGVANNARAGHVAGVRMFFRWLEMRGILACPAIDQLQTPRRTTALPKALNTNEVDVLFSATDQPARDALILVLLYATGLRISELLGLNIGDIQNKTEIIITGKGNKQRMVPLLPVVQQALTDYLPHHPDPAPDAPLLLGARGGRATAGAIQKRFRDLRRQLGLPEHLTPHALRHTFATHLLTGGADLRTLQELLGHASLSSTQIYTKMETDQLLDTFKKAHPRS